MTSPAGGRKPRKLRDVDSHARARWIIILVGAGAPAAVIGALGGLYFAFSGGRSFLFAVPVALGGAALAMSIALGIVALAGGAGRVLHAPSGSSTPRRREYSYPASLVARGRFEEAMAAYEACILEDPHDLQPYVAIARMLRDDLKRFDDAAWWFRRARERATLTPGQAVHVSRELVELYLARMNEPQRALPELARMAELHADLPDGQWAASELARLKARLFADKETDLQ